MRGDRLRSLRHAKGLSQEDVGERIGVTSKQIIRWEGNKAVPSATNVAALAKLFAVSTDYLHGVSDEPYMIYEQSDLSPDEQRLIGALRAGQITPAMKLLIEIGEVEPGDEEAETT